MQFAVKLCRGRKHSKNSREYGKCIRETYASNAVVYVTFVKLFENTFSYETLHANIECIMFGELKSTFPYVVYWITYEYTQTHSLSPTFHSTLIPAGNYLIVNLNTKICGTQPTTSALRITLSRISNQIGPMGWHNSQLATQNHKQSRQHPQQIEDTLNSIKFSGFCATAIGIFDLPANMP